MYFSSQVCCSWGFSMFFCFSVRVASARNFPCRFAVCNGEQGSDPTAVPVWSQDPQQSCSDLTEQCGHPVKPPATKDVRRSVRRTGTLQGIPLDMVGHLDCVIIVPAEVYLRVLGNHNR
ncbi:hypothetical protein F5Y15DRAFT_80934 [Xylariaceae sp. FL0016]|nr:hypothetical protein F5Y15DRAFT_80934 [Xylariaceae sp. FL0016]